MQNNSLEKMVEEFAKPIAEEFGLQVYYVEYVKENKDYYLRIYIDKEDGSISLTDCENVSRRLSEILDEKDPIKDAYYLEVSSPGLNRALHTDEHYKKFIGRDVLVKLKSAIDGTKTIKGNLLDCLNDEILVKVSDKEVNIPKNKIKSANLDGEI